MTDAQRKLRQRQQHQIRIAILQVLALIAVTMVILTVIR
jgi:predicted nucleic acid-binding Zn ribbon protein